MNKWLTAFLIILGLMLIASIFSSFLIKGNSITSNTIAVVAINGIITTQGDGKSLIMGSSGVSSSEIIKQIEKLKDDKLVKGIIFEIDSPGGAVVASQEISDAVKKLNKPKYAVIREVGASGGYWVASATDKIIASPLSITGSIGVTGSYLQFSQLFEKYGVNYERFIGGKYKDLGSSFKEVSDEERRLLQKKIDLIHNYFIREVAKNRKLDYEKVKELATGEFYLGSEAKELGLIDEFGNRDTAVELMKKELKLEKVDVVEVKKEPNIFELLGSFFAYNFGRGFAAEFSKLSFEDKFDVSV